MTLFSANKIFIIAEMANSHEGDVSKAKKIIESASSARADAIKLQKFTADELVGPNHENYNLFKKLEMNERSWREIIKFAKQKNLKVFVDIFGIKSAKLISSLDVDGYKIHSSELTNPNILKFLANTRKPILISVAGSLPNEIDEALNLLFKRPKEAVLMHGFQGYPTSLDELNLLRIQELKKRYCMPIGFMDHISGDSRMALIIPLLAISIGARVIEKHITLDRSMKGIDYHSALNPKEFTKLVTLIRMTEVSLGSSTLYLSRGEQRYRLEHKKHAMSKKFIKKNTKLHERLFTFQRAGKNNALVPFYDFNGKRASMDIPKGTTLNSSMIDNESHKICAVIACRVDSSRLYAKPLQRIGNYTILELVISQLRTSKLINDIVLAISENTGNEVFIDFAKKRHLKFVTGSDNDVLKRLIDGAKYVNADIIFRVTSENPYLYWEGIDTLIKKHTNGYFDFSYIERLPTGSGYEVINLDALEQSHRSGSNKHRSELCSLYIYEHQRHFKINAVKPAVELQMPQIRLTVDTPQDLVVARTIYKYLGHGNKPIPLRNILKLLRMRPEISKNNSNIKIGTARLWN